MFTLDNIKLLKQNEDKFNEKFIEDFWTYLIYSYKCCYWNLFINKKHYDCVSTFNKDEKYVELMLDYDLKS